MRSAIKLCCHLFTAWVAMLLWSPKKKVLDNWQPRGCTRFIILCKETVCCPQKLWARLSAHVNWDRSLTAMGLFWFTPSNNLAPCHYQCHHSVVSNLLLTFASRPRYWPTPTDLLDLAQLYYNSGSNRVGTSASWGAGGNKHNMRLHLHTSAGRRGSPIPSQRLEEKG